MQISKLFHSQKLMECIFLPHLIISKCEYCNTQHTDKTGMHYEDGIDVQSWYNNDIEQTKSTFFNMCSMKLD